MDVTKYYDQAGAPTVEDAVDEAVAQNPLLLHTYAYSGTKRSGDKVYLKVQYYDDSFGSDTAKVREQLDKKADQIVAKIITPGMDDRAKAAAINQYLVDNFAYDYDTYRNEMGDNRSGGRDFYVKHKSNQNASGLLGSYNGENLSLTVCAGYAKAYKLLADKAKLNAIYVTGTVNTSTGNGGHAWNKVKIGNQWLVVDSTWNDTGSGSSDQYLLVTDDSSVIRNRGQVYDHEEIVDAKLADYGIS
nr:transglutaminase domain-containing protein [Bifidobacterium sp. SMB2]